jgi:hypothetical protein
MDWLQFTATVIGHLAWPVVVLILLIIVRKHVGALAERLLEFSFGGAKITFDKILRKGAEIIEETHVSQLPKQDEQPQLQLEPPPTRAPSDLKRDQISNNFARRRREHTARLRNSAFGKVIAGLEEVDNILFEIGDKIGVDAADASSVMYTLVSLKRLPQSIGALYDTLRDARNLLAHSNTLPDDREAIEYERQTNYLKAVLESFKITLDPRSDGNDEE